MNVLALFWLHFDFIFDFILIYFHLFCTYFVFFSKLVNHSLPFFSVFMRIKTRKKVEKMSWPLLRIRAVID